jgi:hypothetical protein
MLVELAEAVAGCADLRDVGELSDAARIERIARLEQLKAAAAALQAAESVRFAQSQVSETRHLPAPLRRHVDTMVAAGIDRMGQRRAAACARKHAYAADPHGYLQRGRTERRHRRVGLRRRRTPWPC